MLNDIGILVNIMFKKDIKEVINSILEEIGENISDQGIKYIIFRNKIEDYLKKEKNEDIKNQLEIIIKELKFSEKIKSRDLDLIPVLEQQLNNKFQDFEIPVEKRENLKNLFIFYFLDWIRKLDINYYNDLEQQYKISTLEQSSTQQDTRIKELFEMMGQMRKIYHLNLPKTESPIKVPFMSLQIDDSSKMIIRSNEMEKIYNYFYLGSNVVFLYGRPGIGKTTLAKMYAKNKHPDGIYFLKYEKSIEYTVGKLTGMNDTDSGKKVLDYWRTSEEAKSVLLIIDNFNEDLLQGEVNRCFEEELEGAFYQELVETGIHIIITTRINVGRNVVEVSSVEKPFELFEMHYNKKIENEKNLIDEIIEALHNNTLLIILSAYVLRRCNNEEDQKQILYKIKNCNLQTDSKKLPVFIDTEDSEVRTIYQQAEALLDMSGILSKIEAKKVFANTVMLPLDGIAKGEFLELTNIDENILMELINGNWVLSDLNRIFIHPVVREIVLTKKIITYSFCEEYCQNIKDKIAIERQFESRLCYKNCAQEIFNIFSSDETMNTTLLKIFYNLSDIYDELAERAMSMNIVQVVEENIEIFNELPFEKAEMLSGISYSLNNYYENMETLERADGILKRALEIIEGHKQDDKWEYARIKGKILSNFGSNRLSKSKCNSIRKKEYLENALVWHRQALEFRQNQYILFLEEQKRAEILRGAIATSYTTIATDYYYLEQYKKSIDTHLQALEIREELGNMKGKSANQQRIIGCVIEWYKQQLGIEKEYISQVLGYYPQLLKLNNEHQNIKSLKTNMIYWTQLMRIVVSDRRFEGYIGQAKEKCKCMIEWINLDAKLVQLLSNEVEELYDYL